MRNILVLAAFLLIAIPISGAADEQIADSGWISLFNGKDLTGWKIHDKPSGFIEEVIKVEKAGKIVGYDCRLKSGKIMPMWRVEDGMLIGSGPPSHLFSERGDFVNFQFRVEAMINDKGNSGQYFRTEFGSGFPRGYEAQINATADDPIRTGSLCVPNVKNVWVLTAPHKAGEFFVQEVTCIGDTITISVNGKKTVDAWRDPQAATRYKKGHFALQVHDRNTVVTFKKIEVKELRADSADGMIHALFIGNSMTRARQVLLPRMIDELARAGNQRPFHYDAPDGRINLEKHWEDGRAALIQSRKWDFVILQEQSGRPLSPEGRAPMFEYAKKFDAEIKKNGAKTILYMTMADKDRPDDQRVLSKAYLDLSKQLKCRVAPAGDAWYAALKADKKLVLHQSDGHHPEVTGIYLSACVFYATIYGKSPEGLPGSIGKLTDQEARPLQAIAWKAVQATKNR